jgi:uncharacterized coiled-coil protein SlyX
MSKEQTTPEDRLEQLEELVRLGEKCHHGRHSVMKSGFKKHLHYPCVFHTGDDLNYVCECKDFANVGDTLNAESAEYIATSFNNRENIKWLLDRVKELETKLETCPSGYDGIDCRDETIKGLEKKVKKQAEAIEHLTYVLKEYANYNNWVFPKQGINKSELCINGDGFELAQEALEKAEEILK